MIPDPVRRLLVVLAVTVLGLGVVPGLGLPPTAAHAAVSDVVPTDPVVRLLALGGGVGLLLVLVGGTGLWLTRRRR